MAGCAICLGSLRNGNPVSLTSCGHLFHRNECLQGLFQANAFSRPCPLCRQRISSTRDVTAIVGRFNGSDDDLRQHVIDETGWHPAQPRRAYNPRLQRDLEHNIEHRDEIQEMERMIRQPRRNSGSVPPRVRSQPQRDVQNDRLYRPATCGNCIEEMVATITRLAKRIVQLVFDTFKAIANATISATKCVLRTVTCNRCFAPGHSPS